jgi:hypothetical protein
VSQIDQTPLPPACETSLTGLTLLRELFKLESADYKSAALQLSHPPSRHSLLLGINASILWPINLMLR